MLKLLHCFLIIGLLPWSSSGDSVLQKDLRNVTFVKFSTSSINNFILGHNGLRNRMAFNTNKTAANMNLIFWGEEMEFKAKFWILKCFGTVEVPKFCKASQYPGINRMELKRLRTGWEFSTIRIWFSPYRRTPDSEIDFLTHPTSFTQLIWATVHTFGCATANIDGGIFIIVCAYDPPGNRIRMQVYKTGHPCSQCEDTEMCSVSFSGLCGVDKMISPARRKFPNVYLCLIMLNFQVALVNPNEFTLRHTFFILHNLIAIVAKFFSFGPQMVSN